MTSLLFAALSSLLASLLGAFSGGGTTLVVLPLLLSIFPNEPYVVMFAVGKLSGTIMSYVSAWIHSRRQKIDGKLLLTLLIPGLLGTAFGTYLVFFQAYEEVFKVLLAISLLLTAVILLNTKKWGLLSAHHHELGKSKYPKAALFSFGVNILNGLFGGTGIFMTVYGVLFLGMNFIEAISYTVSMYILINTLQTGYLLSTVEVPFLLVLVVLIGAFLGSFLGTQLQYRQGETAVKKASVTLMVFIALYTLSKSLFPLFL